MSKLKGKLTRRIMAIVLSGAMVMSNMSAYAAELAPETEVVSEVEETAAAEATADAAGEEAVSDAKEENAETEASVAKSSESKAEEDDTKSTTEAKTEDATEIDTETVESTVAETKEGSGKDKTSETEAEEKTTEKDNKDDENSSSHVFDAEKALGPNGLNIPKPEKDSGGTVTNPDAIKVNAGEKFANDYFVTGGTSTRGNADKYSLELAKSKGSWIQFTVTGTTATVVISASSTGSNPTTVGLIDEDGQSVGEDGTSSSTTASDFTYTVSNGTYKVVGTSTARGARIYMITVTETRTPAAVTTAEVTLPDELEASQSTTDGKGFITLTWKAANVALWDQEEEAYKVTYDVVVKQGTTEVWKKEGIESTAVAEGTENPSITFGGEFEGEDTFDVEADKEYTFSVTAHATKGEGDDAVTAEDSETRTTTHTYTAPGSVDETIYKVNLTKDGLKKDVEYGDSSVLSIKVMEDMPYKEADTAIVSGMAWDAVFQGTNNPDKKDGSIPASGAVFKMTAAKNAKVIFVTKSAAKTYYLVKADAAGKKVDHKSGTSVPDGTLSFDLDAGYTYYFYASGSKVTIYGILYGEYDKNAEKKNWSEVDAPVISKAGVNDTDKKRIDVTVNAVVGTNGGDKLTVEMLDSEGNKKGTAETDIPNIGTSESHVLSFIPEESGSYTFKAILSRGTGDNKQEKTSSVSSAVEFTAPLKAPSDLKVEDKSEGDSISVEFSWGEVKGAESYHVIVKEAVAEGATEEGKEIFNDNITADTKVVIDKDLERDKEYVFSVAALKGAGTPDEEKTAFTDKNYTIPAAETDPGSGSNVGADKHTFDAEKDLASYERKQLVPLGTKFADGYFTLVGTADDDSTGNAVRGDSAVYSIQLRKSFKSYLEFTVTGTADITIEAMSNGGSNTSILALKDKNGNTIPSKEGGTSSLAVGTASKTKFTYSKVEPGTYQIGTPEDATYGRDIRICFVEVAEMPAGLSADIDLSQGLKKGEVYGNENLATLEVLEDMKASNISDGKEIGGEKYYYSVQGSGNPSPNGGDIPTSGAVFKITAYKDTTVKFVTGAAEGKKWHVVRESDKKEVKKGATIPEGTISFMAQPNQTYYFYADGSKVKAYAISMKEYVYIPRDDWATVAPPVITKAEVKEKDGANVIEVSVTGDISDTGADLITVEMYDAEGAPGEMVTSKSTATASLTAPATVSFSPSASGVYYFKAFLSRNAEESLENPDEEIVYDDKESNRYPAEGGIEYEYYLQPPLISAVTNLGNGTIEVDWVKASEATGYEVVVEDAEGNPAGTPNPLVTNQTVNETTGKVTAAATIGNVSGLTVGSTYTVKARAVRETVEEDGQTRMDYSEWTSEKTRPSIMITEGKQIKWSFSASGSSTSLKDVDASKKPAGYGANTKQPANGYHKPDADGNGEKDNDFDVEVWSINGSGKVVPATTDGLAFYYTELNPNDPENPNFTLTARAHVESWTYSNGQDGFGLMVSDTVGEHGNGDYVWTNCYQNVVSKVEFRWDGTKPVESSDTSLPRYSMKLGVGATEKIGATAKDIEDIWSGTISQPAIWSASQYPIDYSMTHLPGGNYNIVGNCTNTPEGSLAELSRVDFDLSIQKNNNGYKLSYTNVATGETTEKQFQGTDVLNQIEADKIYVGVFAGRNADVTFKNVHLETYPASHDPAAEEPEPNYINLISTISSPSTANTSDYDLVFTSNWDGELEVRNSDNVVVGKTQVTGTLDTVIAQYEDGDNNKDTKAHVELSGLAIGSNVFTVTFTPNKAMKNQPAYTELNSYDPVTLTHTVDYRRYGEEASILYVSPNGKSSGTGTKANPLDVYTAIKYVQPGQKIFLAGGRYVLHKTISIARGINGEEGKMIYMMADPEATERPIFDFNKEVTGMTMGGNYWYFKGFDVTGSLDGQKGIQVSGSNNVLDQIQTYMNGNTGIQVSGSGNDTYKYWPQNNLILNCTSYLNSDHGYEDADGFAAKLTIGSGNVFDGCIAAYNADDGWDLFAKIESGQIGSVTIRNSIAYKNGYVLVDAKGNLSLKGEEVDAGNGNGFKMGGDGLPGGSRYDVDENGDNYFDKYGVYKGHRLENSLAFENKSKGFDSNSCSNNKVKNSISFNNKGGNVELYTYNNVQETYYEVQNVISFRTRYTSVIDNVSPKGAQKTDKSAFLNESAYLWSKRPNASINTKNIRVNKSWFKSVTFEGTKASNGILFGRKADGSIDRNGFMELDLEKVKADIESQGFTIEDAGLDLEALGLKGTGSKTDEELKGDSTETPGDISAGNGTITDDDNSGELADELDKQAKLKGINIVEVRKEGVSYTGQAVKPEIRVYLNGASFTDYSVSYKNNVNAYVKGDENYADIPDEKRPQMILKLKGNYQQDYIYYFDIKPVDVGDKSKVASPSIAVDKAQVPKVTLTFNGKNLALGKDFNVYTEVTKTEKDENGADIEITEDVLSNKTSFEKSTTLKVKGTGNFTGTVKIPFINVNELGLKLMSKANVKLAVNAYTYTGSEIVPDITVDGTAIKKSEDGKSYADDLYDVSIANGTEVGKATVTVTAKTIVPPAAEEGSEAPATTPTAVYAGSKTVAFTIKSMPIKLDNVAFVIREKDSEGNDTTKEYKGKNIVLDDKSYTGAARAQAGEFKVYMDDGTEVFGVSKGSRNTNDPGDDTLYKYNYTYEYKNNVEPGTANVIIKGIHNCTGSVSLKFKINPADPVTDIKQYRKTYTDTVNGETVEIRPETLKGKGLEIVYDYDVTYVSSGAKPTVSIYYNGNGVSKKNYSIAYKNNKNVGDPAQAIIKWSGGLKGTAQTTLDYRISKCKFENNVYVKSISDVFTNGKTSIKASEFDKSRAVIMNAKTRLAANRDYTLEYEYDVYDSSLNPVMEAVKNDDGTETGETRQKRLVYDSADKNAKKNDVYVPRTGLDVAVYIKPVTGGKYNNFESTDGGRVKVADIRVAYFDIAKASIKLIDPDTEKNAILYFNDVTELSTTTSNGINCLDQKYIRILHSAYAKSEYYNSAAVDANGCLTCKDYVTRTGDGYTYNKNATDAAKAGTQRVTFYGTGLFGGSKVFKYKLEKKTYDISRAVVDTKEKIYIACDDYINYLASTETDKKISAELKASLEEQLRRAFEGKITGVNGINAELPYGYYTCTYDEKDLKNCKDGKAITVTIKGASSYSGSKKVKIAAQLVSSNLDSASVSAAAVEASKDDIDKGIELDEKKDALIKAIAGKVAMDGCTLNLKYGVDYEVNDAEYIAFEKGEDGKYIEDPNGETMTDDKGEIIKDDSGNPIKYKVARRYTGYLNNDKASTEGAPAYVCIKGIGAFSGTLEIPFTITEKKTEEETPAN